MPVLNLPPQMAAMAGGGAPMAPPMAGGPMGGPMSGGAPMPPGGLQAALASVLMPRQTGFPIRPHLSIPRPTRKKAKGRMSPATTAAVKVKMARAMAGM